MFLVMNQLNAPGDEPEPQLVTVSGTAPPGSTNRQSPAKQETQHKRPRRIQARAQKESRLIGRLSFRLNLRRLPQAMALRRR